ncbi:MAG: signal peptidase I [Propionibacteriaceae bacterium]
MGIKKLTHRDDVSNLGDEVIADEVDTLQPDAEPTEASAQTAVTAMKKKPKQGIGAVLKEFFLVIVGALIISLVLRAFVFQLFEIPSGSMENTLQLQDKVFVYKQGEVTRGTVVVFEDPAGWLPAAPAVAPGRAFLEKIGLAPDTSQNHLIKRVIGLPGDTVECCSANGKLKVNGVEIDESAYLYSDGNTHVLPSNFPFRVVVPADRIFVMGDHRNASRDSRCWLQSKGIDAFVPLKNVVGPAVYIIAPTDHAKKLRGTEAFSQVPAAPAAPAAPVIDASRVQC